MHLRLARLAIFYVKFFIRIFRVGQGQLLHHTEDPSRTSFGVASAKIDARLLEAPRDYTTSKALCLQRQDYCCAITGLYDMATANARSESEPTFNIAPDNLSFLQLAHIISEGTNQILHNGVKRNYAANAWTVPNRFGKIDVVSDINGDDIHRLENVMILSSGRIAFDTLEIWFEETETEHHYRVISRWEGFLRRFGLDSKPLATFASNDNIPRPDPRLLRLHAICAKVAHLSGVANHEAELERDREQFRVLSDDPRSADVLASLLSSVSSHSRA